MLGFLLRILYFSGKSILKKIPYLVFSIGLCNEAYLGIAWDLRATGICKPLDPHTDLETTNTFQGISGFNFDQVFIKAPGLLDFTACICGKG